MRFTITLTILFLSLNLSGQTRTIYGRVISENLEESPMVSILNSDTILIGKTDLDGRFELDVPQETEILRFGWVCMESAEIQLNRNCDTFELILMNDIMYHSKSSHKIDKLRKKRFNKLSELHSLAVSKGLFVKKHTCYSRELIPYKPILDKISEQLKVKRAQIKKVFKELEIGDTIRIPYANRHIVGNLGNYSYAVDQKGFDCVIEGIILRKHKRRRGYNLVYEVINCDECKKYETIRLRGEPLVPGTIVEYNIRNFKILLE